MQQARLELRRGVVAAPGANDCNAVDDEDFGARARDVAETGGRNQVAQVKGVAKSLQ